MSQDQEFEQRWEFRRGDDGFNSSSDDCTSNSHTEPVIKKHKRLSDMLSSENEETGDSLLSQQVGELGPHMHAYSEFTKANQVPISPGKKNHATKTKRVSVKLGNGKKHKNSAQEATSLDDLKMFMESMLGDLKVARETMFSRMREEMKKIMATESASKLTKKGGCCWKKVGQVLQQNSPDFGTLQWNLQNNPATNSSNCYEVLDKQLNHDEAALDKKGKTERAVKKPLYSSNSSNQVVASPHVTLPTILSQLGFENHMVDPLSNYSQTEAARSNTTVDSEITDLLINPSISRGYFSGIHRGEQTERFSQMGSGSMGSFDSHSGRSNVGPGAGFPVPLHRGMGNGVNITGQDLPLPMNSSRSNNVLGLRISGGAIRFSGGNHENFIPNNFQGQMTYGADGGLLACGSQDLKNGRVY